MPGSEWSLVAFTLLSQAGVGILLAGEIIGWFVYKNSRGDIECSLIFKTRVTALILVSTALALSFLHLGSPSKAFNALNNLRFSWLSREILAVIFFLFFLFAALILIRWKKSSSTTVKIFSAAAVCSGIFLILAMSFLYMLSGVLTWDHIITPITFFTTAFLLGFMGVGVLSITERKLSSPSGEKEIYSSDCFTALKTAVNTTFILASAQIFLAIINSLRIQNYNDLYSPFESSLLQEHRSLYSLRIILILAGIGLILLSLIKMKQKKVPLKILVWFIYPAFFLILVSEILGRHLFYALFFRTGL